MIHLLIFLFFSPCPRLFINGLYIYMCTKAFWEGCSQKKSFFAWPHAKKILILCRNIIFSVLL